ncbi:hypothetical protein F4553_007825 [Allocatelliglobosispora scoriae]|uniref:Uncharacterized protein n=1 Tax=Allocatelliglobosispora scoriae TaxID=643052 RepID=A0A841C6I4_9ACTN|nr:hypothetical protein [Allocatelliglobosispora scoriae]MBB5874391.1 hypothetical protein [Allocatelliglobosispora scoriae]
MVEGVFAAPAFVPGFFAGMFPDAGVDELRTDFSHRYQVAREWIQAAETVGEAAGEMLDAAEALRFLRTHLVPGFLLPGTGGHLLATTGGTDDSAASLAELRDRFQQPEGAELVGGYQARTLLVPLTGLDRKAGPGAELDRLLGRWLPAFRGGVDLGTGQLTRLVVLPPQVPQEQLSTLGKGVLMLYEIRHAMGTQRHSPSRRSLDYWRAQAVLHGFEFALLERLGGSAYVSLVDRYARALRREGGLLAEPESVLTWRMRRWLTGIFGELADREVQLWASVAYRNAVAHSMDGRDDFAQHLMKRGTVAA